MTALLLSAAFLLVVGLPPAWASTRTWAIALPLSGLTAGLVLSLATTASLVSGTALLPWVVVCVAASTGASIVAIRRLPRPTTGPASPERQRLPRLRTLGVTAVIGAPLLLALRAAPTEYDAKAIWFLHARWSWEGGDVARAALANPAFGYTHQDYPPLVPGTAASLWSIVAGGDLRVAQAVTGLQTWGAVLLAAVLVASAVGRRAELPVAALGGLFVVACYGVAGGFGTRGYADLLWAGAAIAGAVAALILAPGPVMAGVAAMCFAAAVLTKGEGLVVVAALLVPFAALRWWGLRRRAALPAIGLLVLVLLVGAAWPPIAGHFVTEPLQDITGSGVAALLSGDADKIDRFVPAVTGLWGYARSTFAGSALVILGGLVLARESRRRRHLGSGLWLPAVAVGAFTVFVLVLTAGELEVQRWARDGGFRTMTVVRGLLLAEVYLLAALALDELWPRRRPQHRRRRSRPAEGGLRGKNEQLSEADEAAATSPGPRRGSPVEA